MPLVNPNAQLSLKPMITLGAPGKLAPYALNSGVCICTSNHSEGRLSDRCGSLQRIGLPLLVLVPATAQLLLPLSRSGLILLTATSAVSPLLKYNESTCAGMCTFNPA